MGSVKRAGTRRSQLLWGFALLWTVFALSSPQLAAGAGVSPLPESDYTARGACSAPAPGRASCMALELERQPTAAQSQSDPLAAGSGARTSLATATECAAEFPSGCLTPQDLRSAYFPLEATEAPASEPQTVALVDAYNDPKAEADLQVYSKAFDLPAIHACSGSESGCFEQVGQNGTDALPFPRTEAARKATETVCVSEKLRETELELKKREEACDELVEAEGWAIEISTDIEMTHAICQNCKILLVEANAPVYTDLEAAEETAVRLGATEVSNSWGGAQEGSSGRAFDHPGTVITASAGDYGYLNWTEAEAAEEAEKEGRETGYFAGPDYPAASPDVVAVGGTKLTMSDGVRRSETVWNEDPDPEGGNQGGGGGGCSASFTAQPWQQAVPDWAKVGCGDKRAVADVSADADPYTGVAVYDSVPTIQEPAPGEVVNEPLEWWPIGGTSVASPIIGSMFALAGGAHGVAYPAQTLYSHLGSSALHDITSGGNGACDDKYLTCSGSLSSPLDCGEGVLICNAASGYDGPTGVGTPNGIGAFKVLEEGEPTSKPIEEPGASKSSTPSGGKGEEPQSSGDGESGEGSGVGDSSTGPSDDATQGGATQSESSNTTSTPHAGAVKQPTRISNLTLTAAARAAVSSHRATATQIAFSCTLSLAATVRVSLSIEIHSADHTRWRILPASLAFNAVKGLNRRHLHSSEKLAPGTYRLTLTPAGGTARSITFGVV